MLFGKVELKGLLGGLPELFASLVPCFSFTKRQGKRSQRNSPPSSWISMGSQRKKDRFISDVMKVNPRRVDANERMKEGGWIETNGGQGLPKL